MGASMIPIVYIFLILVVAYVSVGFARVPKLDLALIIVAILTLVYTIVFNTTYEHFAAQEINTDNLKPIELEEDISAIKERLVVYNTAFNKISYNENGNAWLNMIVPKEGESENSTFNFELPPVFSRKSGFYMGNNRLVGPFCNALNIQYHNTFTCVIACKHGNLLVEQSNNEIELVKFYANSPNNNGLSLYIQKGSLQNVNNVQMGKLMLQYSSRDPFQCKLKESDELISFERDVYTFYFIIKDTDHIRVAVMTEKNTNIDEILRFNVENTDVTFSNKELVINRLKNWNGNVYNFALYNVALTDDDITNLYAHMLGEYMKYVNPNYISMIQQYNETLALLNKYVSCPYDKNVCTSCSTVDKWNSMEQVLGASAQCKSAINEFCMANMNHPLCKCWNTQSSTYGSDSCKMFKGIFSEKNTYLDGLSQDDVDYIMTKYGLIRPENCPKPLKTPEFSKNKYTKYDFDKLKIRLPDNDGNRSGNVQKVYETDAQPPGAPKTEYKWDKLKIKYDPGVKYTSAPPVQAKDLKVNNLYSQLVSKEQQKLKDTSDLNIVPDTVTTAQPLAKVEPIVPDTKSAQDSFFSRFMSVALPN